MRLVLALVTLAACSDLPDDGGLDASLIAVCDPPATAPPAGEGDGTPPTGTFAVTWECVSGCDGTVPLVIAQADSLTITVSTRPNGFRDGTATWSIEGEPLSPVLMFEESGCWRRQAAFGECFSGFVLCDRIGATSIAHVAVRDPATGAETVWRMR